MKETPEAIKEKAYTALKALGTSRVIVARRLKAMNCYGIPSDGSACPVAQYMKRKTFRNRYPVVGLKFFQYIDTNYKVTIPLPRPVRMFVTAFDNKRFPSLILKRKR